MAAPAAQVPSAAPGPLPPGTSTDVPGQTVVRFVQAAAPPRYTISTTTGPQLMTTSQQSVPLTIPGSGYMLSIDLEFVFTAGSSTAVLTAGEDAPWNACALVTLDDGGPQNVNIDGFSLYLQNIYGGVGIRDRALSVDTTNVFQPVQTAANATTSGNSLFWLTIPLAINNRNYWGAMGNQDRATKYNLRDDIAANGTYIAGGYSGATLPTVQINRVYNYLPVPGPVAADGRKQEQVPPGYGIIHYLTAIRSDSAPSSGSVVNHYIRNLSNAVRLFILIFRAGTGTGTSNPRLVAASNLPSQIDFVVGTDVVWSESAAHRRMVMWDRYRVDSYNGVLVYDAVRDFSAVAGYELGDHYLYMGNISEAQFRITYPSAVTVGSTAGYAAGSSLTIVTDSLFIPPGVDIYGAAA